MNGTLSKEQKGEIIQDLIDDNNVEGLRALMGSLESPPQTPQPLGTPSSPPYAPTLTVDQPANVIMLKLYL